MEQAEGREGATNHQAGADTAVLVKTRQEPVHIDFSVYFFSADGTGTGSNKYDLLMSCAKFADEHGFKAVWTPERHFVTFGGLYPNPSLLAAAIAVQTKRLEIRAGSVVLPLHSPVRIAEEWGLVDNLSNGRVGISFATGWHQNDFVIKPENYHDRREMMFAGIPLVRDLWAGRPVSLPGVDGVPQSVLTLPRPVQPELPVWVTSTSPRTWHRSGQIGAGVLSGMPSSINDLAEYIRDYRLARAQNGHDPRSGTVSIMLHTFLGTDRDLIKEMVREPLKDYLKNYMRQTKDADQEQTEQLLEKAFEHYMDESSLIGTPESCARMARKLAGAGVNEINCLVDFGIEKKDVMNSLHLLAEMRQDICR